MDIVQLFESGSTVALAIVVWYEVRSMRTSLETLSSKITALFTKDLDSRAASNVALGEVLGRIDTQLNVLIETTRMGQANGSDTKYPSARRGDLT